MVSPSTREQIRKNTKDSTKKVRLLSVVVVLGVIFAAFRLYSIETKSGVEGLEEVLKFPTREAEILATELQPDLRKSFSVALNESARYSERFNALNALASSGDSMTEAVLLNAASQVEDKRVYARAERLLVKNSNPESKLAERFILEWLDVIRHSKGRAANYPPFNLLLQANSADALLDRRLNALGEALEQEPNVGLNVALAISLDGNNEEEFQELIRDYLTEQTANPRVKHVRLSALILGIELFDKRFTEKAIKDFDTLPSADLRWILSRVVKFESAGFSGFIRKLLSRKSVPAFQRVLLEMLISDEGVDAPYGVRTAIVHASFGRATSEDVAAISNWISTDAEKALLVICATSSDEAVALKAFDSLAGMSLSTQPAKSLVTWVRDSAWDSRNQAVRSVGVLGFADSASKEQITAAFDKLVPISTQGFLYNAVSQSGNMRLIKIALDRYGAILPSSTLLKFLKDEDREIRIAAVRGLAGRNNIQVLQKIADAFEGEEDDEVRQVYTELHWVAKKRQSQEES